MRRTRPPSNMSRTCRGLRLQALGIDAADLVVKIRRKHEQGDQYARIAEQESGVVVSEGDLRFIVNLEDRIDTGLFLDHRIVRRVCRRPSVTAGACSTSQHGQQRYAAVGGASKTTSVDLSNTYLD